MNWLFKPIVQSVIGDYVVSDNIFVNTFIMAVILVVCGGIVYSYVGVLYREGIIAGSNLGSAVYWLLTLVLVTIIVLVIKTILSVIAFVSSLPIIVLIVTGGLLVLGVIIGLYKMIFE